MELIDTHAHIFDDKFDNDREQMLQHAIEQGIAKIVMPNIDKNTFSKMLALEDQYPDRCLSSIGLHPCDVKDDWQDQIQWLEQRLYDRNYIAIGETGMDLYWDKTFKEAQQQALQTHIDWALERDLPVILHTRNANQEVIDIFQDLHRKPRGVFHCFAGTYEEAKSIIDLGFYLGIGGVLTFKNSGLDKVIKDIDLSNIILETDSPFLAPQAKRGKRNEPSYVNYVADKLAEIKGISKEEVANTTTHNAQQLFRIN